MSPAELHPHDEGNERIRLEETFRRLARAPHASADFHQTVMTRAAMLPAPQKAWRYRLFNPEVPGVVYLQRGPAMAFVGILLCCLLGLGYLYQHVAQLQITVQQERQLRQQRERELAQLRQKLDAREPFSEDTLSRIARDEREDLSRTVLQVAEPKPDTATESPPQTSLATKASKIAKDALEAIVRFVLRVWQGVIPSASDRDTDKGRSKP